VFQTVVVPAEPLDAKEPGHRPLTEGKSDDRLSDHARERISTHNTAELTRSR